jgi:hypothetical protein
MNWLDTLLMTRWLQKQPQKKQMCPTYLARAFTGNI